MRITGIEANWVSIPIAPERQHKSDFGQVQQFDSCIVRIETDAGIVGWGEGKNAAGSAGTYYAIIATINQEFAPRLIGKDPRDISLIWDSLYNGVRSQHASERGHVARPVAPGRDGRGDQRHRHRVLGHSGQVARPAHLAVARWPQSRAHACLRLGWLGQCG